MSIARSHSFREGETASADFTAFSYGAEKRATTLLLDRRSDPFDSYKSRDLQLDRNRPSARSIARGNGRANDSWLTFFSPSFFFNFSNFLLHPFSFRSRRRPPPRCRRSSDWRSWKRSIWTTVSDTLHRVNGYIPCFCITLHRWKTDSVVSVSQRSNTRIQQISTTERSASKCSWMCHASEIFQKAYHAFRIALFFALPLFTSFSNIHSFDPQIQSDSFPR